jgi:hypothetical protein
MATESEKIVMYRDKAKDESIPQEVRNTYLDRANELERKLFEASKSPSNSTTTSTPPPKKLAKGGMIVNKGVGASMKPHNVYGSKGKK